MPRCLELSTTALSLVSTVTFLGKTGGQRRRLDRLLTHTALRAAPWMNLNVDSACRLGVPWLCVCVSLCIDVFVPMSVCIYLFPSSQISLYACVQMCFYVMCLFILTWMYLYLPVCVCLCLSFHICKCVFLFIFICMCVLCVCLHVSLCMYIWMCLYLLMCICLYINTLIFVCMCVFL